MAARVLPLLEHFGEAQISRTDIFGSLDLRKPATRVAKLPPALWLTVPLEAIARACFKATAPRRLSDLTAGKPWARRFGITACHSRNSVAQAEREREENQPDMEVRRHEPRFNNGRRRSASYGDGSHGAGKSV